MARSTLIMLSRLSPKLLTTTAYRLIRPSTHIYLLTRTDAQDIRVVPEPGTADKAYLTFTLPILANQDRKIHADLLLSGACDTKTDIVVLVRRIVVVPVGGRQVVGVVVPIAATHAPGRRFSSSRIPSGL